MQGLVRVAHAWRVRALDSSQGQDRPRAKMETYRPRVEEMIESIENIHQLALFMKMAKTVSLKKSRTKKLCI